MYYNGHAGKSVLNDVIVCNISLFGKKLTAAKWGAKKLENIHSLLFFLWFSYLEQVLKSKKISWFSCPKCCK